LFAIVPYLVFAPLALTERQVLVHGRVPAARYPAVGVGVLLVAGLELGGHPAVDGVAGVLLGAHDEAEEDAEGDRVAVGEAVHVRVVVADHAQMRGAHPAYRPYQIHLVFGGLLLCPCFPWLLEC